MSSKPCQSKSHLLGGQQQTHYLSKDMRGKKALYSLFVRLSFGNSISAKGSSVSRYDFHHASGESRSDITTLLHRESVSHAVEATPSSTTYASGYASMMSSWK